MRFLSALRLLVFAVPLLALPLLAGCGGSGDTDPVTPPPDETLTGAARFSGSFSGTWDIPTNRTRQDDPNTAANEATIPISVGGTFEIEIERSGSFSGTLRNSSSDSNGVIGGNSSVQMEGTISDGGRISGRVSDGFNSNNLTGTVQFPTGQTNRLLFSLRQVANSVQYDGTASAERD